MLSDAFSIFGQIIGATVVISGAAALISVATLI